MKPNSEILIDVTTVTTKQGLHHSLSMKLGFPGYYGYNWDAFDECIRDFPPEGPIRIEGMQLLESRLPEAARLLRVCLSGYQEEQGGLDVHYN